MMLRRIFFTQYHGVLRQAQYGSKYGECPSATLRTALSERSESNGRSRTKRLEGIEP